MEVRKVVVHQLTKEPRSNEVDVYLSQSTAPHDSQTKKLVEKLDKSFLRDRVACAVFDKTNGHRFPLTFESYASQDFSTDSFLNFASQTIEALKDAIRNVPLAKGGYFVYAHYVDEGINHTGIFLVRDAEGVIFNRNEENQTFDIADTTYLNIDKLAMACRINHSKYNLNTERYLQYVDTQRADTSRYFEEWIAASRVESSKTSTEKLYSVLGNIPPPIDEETGSEYSVNDLRRQVADIVSEHPKRIVDTKHVGAILWGNENIIPQYCNQQGIALDTNFPLHTGAAKKYRRIDAQSDGITLKFPKSDFERKVRISEDGKSIIIDSPQLAEVIRRKTNE